MLGPQWKTWSAAIPSPLLHILFQHFIYEIRTFYLSRHHKSFNYIMRIIIEKTGLTNFNTGIMAVQLYKCIDSDTTNHFIIYWHSCIYSSIALSTSLGHPPSALGSNLSVWFVFSVFKIADGRGSKLLIVKRMFLCEQWSKEIYWTKTYIV
jgi:hypothetical protein